MIRPVDLQNAILAAQSAPGPQRVENEARLDAQAAQAAFVAQLTQREEQIAPAAHATGNRVDAKEKQHAQSRRRKRRSGDVASDVDQAGPDKNDGDALHFIDVVA